MNFFIGKMTLISKISLFCLLFLFLNVSIASISNAAYLELTPNDDLSISSPYDEAVLGSGNWGYSSAGTRDFITIGQKYRIRQNGTISRAKIYLINKSYVSGFYIMIWRKDGSNYDLVGTSENIIDDLNVESFNIIDLSSPISGVQEGDYYGYRITTSSEGAYHQFYARTGQSSVVSYLVNEESLASDYDWESKSAFTGTVLPIELYMQSPQVVFIGDSIIAGHPSHYSFLETSSTTNIDSTIENQFGDLTGYTYQNMGIGSQNTSQIAARFNEDVVNLNPRLAIIEGGVNDIAGGSITKEIFLSNWTSMLDACSSNNIIPLVIPIMPWTNGTTSQMNTRDDWNASLVALAETYDDAIIVDVSSDVGEFRTGGPEGNLWNIQTAYNADGVHYNFTGHGVIAAALASALEEYVNHLIIAGSSSQTAGNSQTISLYAYNNFGDVCTSYTGDKNIIISGADSIGVYVPTFKDKNNNKIDFGDSGVITFADGVATTGITLYKNESAEIEITDGMYSSTASSSYDLNVSVSSSVLADFSVDYPASITSEAPFAFSLTSLDSYGNTTTDVSEATSLSVSEGEINLSQITSSELQDDSVYSDNLTISKIYSDKNINLYISNNVVNKTQNISVIGVPQGSVFTIPTKPNTSNTEITTSSDGTISIQNLPDNIYQIAISRTPDFEDSSWEDFDAEEFLAIDQVQGTLYIKFRTTKGTVSDVIVYEPNNITINDGDIVKTANNPDVYVIKVINNKKFKRLILSPNVFNSYQHLKWENIKIISESKLNQYITSDLVKETNDTTIYQLIPNGDKGKRTPNNQTYDPDSVYEINKTDRDSYDLE